MIMSTKDLMNDAIKPKILLIEDEPALSDIYSTKLRLSGYEVVTAADGVAGLDQAVHGQPDLVFLDIVLPLKDGFDVLRDLKAFPGTRAIPVIIMSNLGQDYEIKRGMELGAVRFLVKANIDPADVVKEADKLLKTKNATPPKTA